MSNAPLPPSLRLRPLASLVVTLAAGASFAAACAEGVEKKDFGEDFSDSGRKDSGTITPEDGAAPELDGASPGDSSVPPVDSEAPDTSLPDGATCTGVYAVLSGDDTSAKGSLKTGASWATQNLAGDAVLSGPAIVPFGAGFTAAFRSTGDALKIVTAQGATFGAASRLGTSSTRGTPTLAASGADMHLVFQDTAYQYMHTAWSGAAFGAAAAVGTPTSFGPEPLSAALVGADLVVAFGGDSQGALYVQSRTGAAWGAAAAVAGTNVCATAGGGGVSRCGGAPALLATGGATNDLLAVHIDRTTRLLTQSTRNATTKVTTANGPVAAGTTSDDEVFLAKAGANRAVLVFRGQNGLGYASLVDLSQSPPTFAAPTQLSASALASVPRVTSGVCGDDAAAVFVTTAGQVRLVHLRGTTWGNEEAVGTTGATNKVAAVASRP